ncbi:hypothetical protein [Streptomyces cinnamoneus]|uniref:hypothetical protein n=1 Tax=Streptomyces cinnamoneus TaxID=53446 RepID=UPI001865A070|nr:hypothetical protein [Streptomyces cinnamoneus]
MKSLRDEAPVFFSEDLHMWIVSRYDDVTEILKNAELFPASTRSIIMSSYPPEVREVLASTSTFTAPNMGFDGSPAHERLRKPVVPYFSAKGARLLEPRIEEIAGLRAEEVPAEPPVDLVQAYARPLANSVVIALAGFPAEDHDRILRYHRAVNEFSSAASRAPPTRLRPRPAGMGAVPVRSPRRAAPGPPGRPDQPAHPQGGPGRGRLHRAGADQLPQLRRRHRRFPPDQFRPGHPVRTAGGSAPLAVAAGGPRLLRRSVQ